MEEPINGIAGKQTISLIASESESINAYETLDQALYSLNHLTKINTHIQELVVSIIRNNFLDETALLKQTQELVALAKQQQEVFEGKLVDFKAFQFSNDGRNIANRFYQRLIDKINRKLVVYSKYRHQLKFLGPSAMRFWKAKDLLSASEGIKNLNAYSEVVSMIISENQLLQNLMIELMVSENIVSSVEEFNTLQPNKANRRRSKNINKGGHLPLRKSEQSKLLEQHMNIARRKVSRESISPIITPKSMSVTDIFDKIKSSYTNSEQFYSSLCYESFKNMNLTPEVTKQNQKNKFQNMRKLSKKVKNVAEIMSSSASRKSSFMVKDPSFSRRDSVFQVKHQTSTHNPATMQSRMSKSTFETQINQAIKEEFRQQRKRSSPKNVEPFQYIEIIDERQKDQNEGEQPKISFFNEEANKIEQTSSPQEIQSPERSKFQPRRQRISSRFQKQARSTAYHGPMTKKPEHLTKKRIDASSFEPSHPEPPKTEVRRTITLQPSKSFGDYGLSSLKVTRKYNFKQEQNPKQLVEKADDPHKNSNIREAHHRDISELRHMLLNLTNISHRNHDFNATQLFNKIINKNNHTSSESNTLREGNILRIPNCVKKFLKAQENVERRVYTQKDVLGKESVHPFESMLIHKYEEPRLMSKLPKIPRREFEPKIQIYCTRQYKIIS